MKNKIDIDPTDENGRLHGYQQWYYDFDKNDMDKLWFRGYLKHLIKIGYSENHRSQNTEFHII